MDAAIAGLVGVGIGACFGIINSLLNNSNLRVLEKEKSRLAQQAELSKELRSHIVNVAQQLFSAQHSIEWVCWYAIQEVSNFDQVMLSNYTKEIHDCFPKLLGYLAAVASFDNDAFTKLSVFAEKIYEMDSDIAKAAIMYKNNQEKLIVRLGECYDKANDLTHVLPPELTKIMSTSQNKNMS